MPNWSLRNRQIGGKFEGITSGGLSFSLNALHYRSPLPSLRGGTGGVKSAEAWPYLIAFDLAYPEVNLIGGSLDFQWQAAKAAIRFEAAMTEGEKFANTLRPELYSSNNVFRCAEASCGTPVTRPPSAAPAPAKKSQAPTAIQAAGPSVACVHATVAVPGSPLRGVTGSPRPQTQQPDRWNCVSDAIAARLRAHAVPSCHHV